MHLIVWTFVVFRSVQLNVFHQLEYSRVHIDGVKSKVSDGREKLHSIWQEVNLSEEDAANIAKDTATESVSCLSSFLPLSYFMCDWLSPPPPPPRYDDISTHAARLHTSSPDSPMFPEICSRTVQPPVVHHPFGSPFLELYSRRHTPLTDCYHSPIPCQPPFMGVLCEVNLH